MADAIKDFYKTVQEKICQDTVFIIGGGPSKNKYLPDNSVLANKHVIAINNAYTIFPNALLTHFADFVWYGWHKKKIHDLFSGPITTAEKSLSMYKNLPITVFKKEYSKHIGLISGKDTLAGNNAGHQSINLAYHLGFKKVVLIGFDMNAADRQTHWHTDHPVDINTGMYKRKMIPGMERVAADARSFGLSIYNINRESTLKCFEFADLKDFL